MSSQQMQLKSGIVKQVLSGDSVKIRGQAVGGPPPEVQIIFTGIVAPKLARRGGDNTEPTRDEPWAWEAREYVRTKLIGQEVLFSTEPIPNNTKGVFYGTVYLGRDVNTAENVTEMLVEEGLVSLRKDVSKLEGGARLQALEEAAKTEGRGKWCGDDPTEHVRDVTWSIPNMTAFMQKLDFKPVRAIIEHVRDGSTVRAFLLPDFHYVTLMMTGIRCPGFKLDGNGKPDPNIDVPYAKEARYFVEVRLLNQEVEIVLEAVNNSNFVGTILHPKGRIAEALLKEGLASCVEWSMKFMRSGDVGMAQLKTAEDKAKQAGLRIWKDRQQMAAQHQKQQKDRTYSACVVEVINADALTLKLTNGEYKKVFLSSIRPPKEMKNDDSNMTKSTTTNQQRQNNNSNNSSNTNNKPFRPLYDIPGMFEVREYLRRKLIGRKVMCTVDFSQPARDSYPEKTCVTVTLNGKNVAEDLVSKGYATVIKYRHDDDQRSCQYHNLVTAESSAVSSELGVHSKKEMSTRRVTEIDVARAKIELPYFQRTNTIEAIVEFVISGSKFRLFIPKKNYICMFSLAKINCPRASSRQNEEAEPYGMEAVQFSRDRCLQRDVTIEIETCGRTGSFIGWMWVDSVNVAVALAAAGLARVQSVGGKSAYDHQLREAEEAARKSKLKIWTNYVEEAPKAVTNHSERPSNFERKIDYKPVVVTEIRTEGTFFVQLVENGAELEEFYSKLRQQLELVTPAPLYSVESSASLVPKRGTICTVKYRRDGEWYRARIEKCHVDAKKATILYVDYGNQEIVPFTHLFTLPAMFTAQSPFAKEYSFAYVTFAKDEEMRQLAVKCLHEDTYGHKLLLNVEYDKSGAGGGPPAASLHFNETVQGDIVRNLIAEGLLMVEKTRNRRSNSLVALYKEAQQLAKKQHLNMWEYGDISEDEDQQQQQ